MDQDNILAALFVVDHLGLGAHVNPAAPGAIGLDDTGPAIDDTGRRKIGAGYVLHQLIDRQVRVSNQRQTAADHLGEVVRRNIGGHTHRDARGTVDQQIGDPGRHNGGNAFGAIIVIDKIDSFLVEIRQNGVRDLAHADFGVTHGRRGIAIHRTEVALAVHQHIAQGEWLGHPHDGVVDRRIAVRVVLTDHIPHHAGRLLIPLVPVVAELVHREQHAPVHRFQAVAHIGQSPPHDHAHRVIQVGLFHLVFNIDGEDFFG